MNNTYQQWVESDYRCSYSSWQDYNKTWGQELEGKPTEYWQKTRGIFHEAKLSGEGIHDCRWIDWVYFFPCLSYLDEISLFPQPSDPKHRIPLGCTLERGKRWAKRKSPKTRWSWGKGSENMSDQDVDIMRFRRWKRINTTPLSLSLSLHQDLWIYLLKPWLENTCWAVWIPTELEAAIGSQMTLGYKKRYEMPMNNITQQLSIFNPKLLFTSLHREPNQQPQEHGINKRFDEYVKDSLQTIELGRV